MKTLSSIIGNSQKLDGGAMFGHVPQALWKKWITPDEHNRISLACRALLIHDENKTILLETGVGAFFEPALRERYGVVESEHVLLNSLNKIGLSDEDIDIVILSHLHFDHAGGLLSAWNANETPKLLFKNAQYLVSKEAWERAQNPHIRDQASFIPELNKMLDASGRLQIIDQDHSNLLGKDYRFVVTNGHTPGLLHTIIESAEGPIFFASDLVPGALWLHLPVGMGYDRLAELLADEKKEMLNWAIENHARIFYTHDPQIAMSNVILEAGKFKPINPVGDFYDIAV